MLIKIQNTFEIMTDFVILLLCSRVGRTMNMTLDFKEMPGKVARIHRIRGISALPLLPAGIYIVQTYNTITRILFLLFRGKGQNNSPPEGIAMTTTGQPN
jgi:hypothetical protein